MSVNLRVRLEFAKDVLEAVGSVYLGVVHLARTGGRPRIPEVDDGEPVVAIEVDDAEHKRGLDRPREARPEQEDEDDHAAEGGEAEPRGVGRRKEGVESHL